ncbi:MAG: MFS transporter [Rhodospirillales bacterium]|nr:MFS transporter [Rhodospirillales bacterium]
MRSARAWIYVLLFTGCTINYVDRVALSVAAAPIAAQFHVSPVGMGYLFSAFLWTYLVALIPWGVAIDRLGTRWATAGGMALWSLATVLTGLAGSYPAIFVMRLTMGLGEASTYPSGGRVIREWIPSGERGLATVVFNSGGYAGPAFGAVLVGAVASAFGWRAGFIAAGVTGFIWLAVWLAWFRRPEDSPYLGAAERARILRERGGGADPEAGAGRGAGLPALLRNRTLWALFVTQGCAVYAQYLFLTWMPSYLQATRHLGILQTGLYSALPYAVAVLGTMLVGRLSDRMLRARGAAGGQRRYTVAGMMLVSAVILAVPFVADIRLILLLFTVSLTGIASAVGLNIALLNDLLAEPGDSGKANGFLVSGGNLFGILAPILTGYVVAGTGRYDGAFLIAGGLPPRGATVCLLLTRQPIAAARRASATYGAAA